MGKGSYAYLAQNTAEISRNALASGSCDDGRKRGLEEHLAAGRIEIQLKRWTLIPLSSDLGERIDAALRRGSRFQSVLSGYPPDATTVTIWVYPDSFSEFREIKKHLFQLGFATAGRPLPAGFPISGSPEGSKSAAE
jgi:hypothetical protein